MSKVILGQTKVIASLFFLKLELPNIPNFLHFFKMWDLRGYGIKKAK